MNAPSEEAEKKIISLIDSNAGDLVRTCSELIQINSENPKNDCQGVVDFLEYHYRKIGVDYFKISADRKSLKARGLSYPRNNFVAVLGKSRKHVGLSIGTHMDVVPAGDQNRWRYSPFSGRIADGKIWGRGACDAKCSLAAQLFAAKALRESAARLQRSILLIGTVDDEAPREATWPGMEFMVKHGGLEKMRFGSPRFAINAEASGLGSIWGIFTGSVTLKLEFLGRPGHPPVGVNALESAVSFWSTIKSRTEFSRARLVWLSGGSDSDFGQTPQEAEIIFRVSISSSDDPIDLVKLVRSLLLEKKKQNPDFKYSDVEILSLQRAYNMGSESRLVAVIKKAASKAGVRSSYGGGVVGAGDLYYYLEKGIQGVTYGAGSLDKCHVPNEFVHIEDLVAVTKIYALTGLALCAI